MPSFHAVLVRMLPQFPDSFVPNYLGHLQLGDLCVSMKGSEEQREMCGEYQSRNLVVSSLFAIQVFFN